MAKNSVVVKFLADVDGMRKGIDKVNGQLSGFERGMKRVGVAIAGAFAVDKIVDFGRTTINLASELEQAAGAAEALFGPTSAAKISDWAAGAASELGLSASAATEAANRFSVAGKQMGLTGDDLVAYSQDMTAAAADLSAMFGGDVTSAINAVSAALRGEFDPLERYGIAINQAAIDAEAASLGFKRVNGTWDQLAKSTAISSIIAKQNELNGTTGAFAREANTYAGQMARLSAEWENFQTVLGQAILPTITGIVEGLRQLLDWAQKNTDALQLLGGAALVAAGRFVILRFAAAGGWTAATTAVQGFGFAVQFLGVRAAATGIALGGLRLALAAVGGPWGLLIGAMTVSVIALNQEASRTKEIIKQWGLEEEVAAGKIKTNTAIIAAARTAANKKVEASAKAARDAASAAAWNTAGAWSDANGTIVGSTYKTYQGIADAAVDAANVVIGAANQAAAAWEGGQKSYLSKSYLSGTITSAIAEAGYAAAKSGAWVPFEQLGKTSIEKVGKGASGGSSKAKDEVKKVLKDWAGEFDYITADIDVKAKKANASLVEGYKEKLGVLLDAVKLYNQTVTDALAEVDRQVKEKAQSLTTSFLGFNLSDFIKEIKDDDGNVTSTIFDSEAFSKWLGDRQALTDRVKQLVGVIPEAWISSIMAMPKDAANATLSYLLGNEGQNAVAAAGEFEKTTQYIYDNLSLPLAETYREMYWEAQQAGIEAAKQAVKDAREDFQKFVRKQLKTTVDIGIRYYEINPPPSTAAASSGRSLVAALQDYERNNGTAWRL